MSRARSSRSSSSLARVARSCTSTVSRSRSLVALAHCQPNKSRSTRSCIASHHPRPPRSLARSLARTLRARVKALERGLELLRVLLLVGVGLGAALPVGAVGRVEEESERLAASGRDEVVSASSSTALDPPREGPQARARDDDAERASTHRPNWSEKPPFAGSIQCTRLLPPGRSTLKYSAPLPSAWARAWNVDGSATSVNS